MHTMCPFGNDIWKLKQLFNKQYVQNNTIEL